MVFTILSAKSISSSESFDFNISYFSLLINISEFVDKCLTQ